MFQLCKKILDILSCFFGPQILHYIVSLETQIYFIQIAIATFSLDWASCNTIKSNQSSYSVQDTVFVTVVCSIQYRVVWKNADDAFYELQNPWDQIQCYVFDGK